LNKKNQACELYGDAQCLKIFVTKVETEIEIHDLTDDNPDIPSSYNKTKTKYEWELLQSKPNCDDNHTENEWEYEDEYENHTVSVVRVYEFYNYTGAYDSETHKALDDCKNDTSSFLRRILGSDKVGKIGNYLGSQRAALVSETGTDKPSKKPYRKPTRRPTKKPNAKPSRRPTQKPRRKPTRRPTRRPRRPSARPTRKPRAKPTIKPIPV